MERLLQTVSLFLFMDFMDLRPDLVFVGGA
jgi:hypothetical protein